MVSSKVMIKYFYFTNKWDLNTYYHTRLEFTVELWQYKVLVWFLLFNGISTFEDDSMPKSSF